MNKALFSSKKEDWATPDKLFEELSLEFGPFDLDPCATKKNARAKRFFTKREDGLTRRWAPSKVWLNPPYGRQIGSWIKKAWEESQKGALVVCLLPARTDTDWWHNYVKRGEIRFLKGRLKFKGAKHSAPFPSAVVVFYPFARLSNRSREEEPFFPPASYDLARSFGEEAYRYAIRQTFPSVQGRKPRFFSPGWMGETMDIYRSLAWLAVLKQGR